MNDYKEIIHNILTNEIVERQYTKAEIDEAKANETRLKIESEAIIANETAKITLFAKLGLTPEEAKLLLS
jgi:hypothetical protein